MKIAFYWEGTTITGFMPEKLSGVTKVIISTKCTVIRSDYAFLGTEDYRSFVAGIAEVEILNSVIEIGSYAFHNFTKLTSINIPSSITNIGIGAFYACSSLTSITIPESVTNIGASAFWGISLININFKGTMSEWNNITKLSNWNENSSITTITCTDGIINL